MSSALYSTEDPLAGNNLLILLFLFSLLVLLAHVRSIFSPNPIGLRSVKQLFDRRAYRCASDSCFNGSNAAFHDTCIF